MKNETEEFLVASHIRTAILLGEIKCRLHNILINQSSYLDDEVTNLIAFIDESIDKMFYKKHE